MQSSTRTMIIAGAVALAQATGCQAEQPTEFQATMASQCEVCGTNSPILGRFELSLRGEPNRDGYSMVMQGGDAQLIQGGTAYSLRIILSYLKGAHATLPRLTHDSVLGAMIPIQRDGVQYELTVRAVHRRKYAIAPLWELETYTLGWRQAGGEEINPCALPEGAPAVVVDPIDTRAEWHLDEAVVIEGDRADPHTRALNQTADDQWFTIACTRDAMAKMLATRNTVHSQPAGLAHAWEQRQAALRMMTGDVCGTGDMFTVQGQAVVWQGGGTEYLHPPEVLEARWTPNGAACVYAPRMLFPTTPEGAAAFPDIWAAIRQVCDPPICSDLDPLNFDGAYFVSAKPVE